MPLTAPQIADYLEGDDLIRPTPSANLALNGARLAIKPLLNESKKDYTALINRAKLLDGKSRNNLHIEYFVETHCVCIGINGSHDYIALISKKGILINKKNIDRKFEGLSDYDLVNAILNEFEDN